MPIRRTGGGGAFTKGFVLVKISSGADRAASGHIELFRSENAEPFTAPAERERSSEIKELLRDAEVLARKLGLAGPLVQLDHTLWKSAWGRTPDLLLDRSRAF